MGQQPQYVYRLWSNRSACFIGEVYYTEQGAINKANEIQRMYFHALHTVEVERFPVESTDRHGDVVYETVTA